MSCSSFCIHSSSSIWIFSGNFPNSSSLKLANSSNFLPLLAYCQTPTPLSAVALAEVDGETGAVWACATCDEKENSKAAIAVNANRNSLEIDMKKPGKSTGESAQSVRRWFIKRSSITFGQRTTPGSASHRLSGVLGAPAERGMLCRAC